MDIHTAKLVGVFVMSLLVGGFSAMSGSAGGIVMTPFFIWLGLTPQQTIATGKFASFGLSIGAITAFRKKVVKEKRSILVAVIVLSILIGIVSAYTFQRVGNATLQKLIGVFMLLMIPAVWGENAGTRRKRVSKFRLRLGYVALAGVLFIQGVFGGGVGTILSVVFILFFGTTAIEANMLQRIATLLLNSVIVLLILHTSLIVFDYGTAALIGALIGGFAGSKFALKKGEKFAKVMLMAFMAIAGVALILGA